jgi:hypothetical protein
MSLSSKNTVSKGARSLQLVPLHTGTTGTAGTAGAVGATGGSARDWSGAVTELELAVAACDALPYFEPEHWYLPLRHCLGEALLRAGEPARAAAAFRRDLR